MTTLTTQSARHVLFQLANGSLPDALLGVLRDEVVLAGWVRATGTLRDVRVRAPGSATVRSLGGTVHLITLDGNVGGTDGDVTCGLRVVLGRENDLGALETVAGELVSASIVSMDGIAMAFDDLTVSRDRATGTWSLGGATTPATTPRAPALSPAPAPPPVPAPSAPIVAAAPAPSEPALPAKPKPSPTFSGSAMPAKLVKVVVEEEEQPTPDAGDVVEHFAFGTCEVVKSDGDRLHLRLGKDGRIKEIALEMLKVTPLPPVEGSTGNHYKLDRRL